MKNVFAAAVILAAFDTGVAYGQSSMTRLYAGVGLSAIRVGTDDVDPGGSAAAGGSIGIRITPHFSIEAEAGRGFGELSRTHSGPFVSFAGPGSAREDVERLAVTMRSDTIWKPGFTWAALAVWKAPEAGRLGAAVFAGVSATRYQESRALTVLNIPPAVDVTEARLHQMLPDSRTARVRGGLTGGVLFPVKLTPQLSVAPEIRYTYGSVGDETYTTLRGGVRVLWGF